MSSQALKQTSGRPKFAGPPRGAGWAQPGPGGALKSARWALLFGNFVTGCGVMSAAGTLNDLARSLDVSVALAGQLIATGAAVMCFGAPLLAGLVSGWDRRRLLALAMLWYAVGHLLCMLTTSYASLWPTRALTLLAGAVFTPQAAAAIGFMASPRERGRSITFVFLGWSLASVLGMPVSAWLGESFGWRSAFALIVVLSLLAALWIHRALPDGVKPAALSRRAWGEALTHPLLMTLIAVTALQSAAQFVLFAYFAPYYRLTFGAGPGEISLLFGWFGAFGLTGNILLSRVIDRVGASRAVFTTMSLIALSLLLWPLATTMTTMALVLVPWALGCFATNSGQQVRLSLAAPILAPALMALNTSAMYFGQALGSASGGWLLTQGGFAMLNWAGLAFLLAAMALSVWVARRAAPHPASRH